MHSFKFTIKSNLLKMAQIQNWNSLIIKGMVANLKNIITCQYETEETKQEAIEISEKIKKFNERRKEQCEMIRLQEVIRISQEEIDKRKK